MKNVFDNPKLFIKQINDNIKINKTIKFNGKSFICVFFTKKCTAGCKFCFFKSNNRKLNDIAESYEMSDYGFERFIKFVNESNNGYLLISGGGEPFEKKEYVFRTIEQVNSDKIVIVSNGLWAKKYDSAKKIVDRLYKSLKNKNKNVNTDVTLRISIDSFHLNQVGKESYENIINIFDKYYKNKSNFHLKIHTIISDNAVYSIAKKNNFYVSENTIYDSSDNNEIFKLVPKKFDIYTKNKLKIEVGAAKLFYPNVLPNMKEKINENAIKVFDKDIIDSETCNPAIVNNINGEKGLDFWINYNGNITTWQNEQFDNIMNIYNDNYADIVNKTFNNLLSFSFIEKGYYHREHIISKINKKAVLRSKLSNMRDLSTAMLLHESKTRLYYYITIIREYWNELVIDKNKLSNELTKVLNMDDNEIKMLYKKSDYSIIDDYILEESSELEMNDLFYMIKLGEYDVNKETIKRGLNYLNTKYDKNYCSIDDISCTNNLVKIDRIIEKLTRMEYKSHEKCMFLNGLINKNYNLIQHVSKSDLHGHATRSGKKEYFEKKYNTIINTPNSFKTISEMNDWYDKNIKILFSNDIESFRERLKSAFIAATNDNIKKLCLSFGVGNIKIFAGSVDRYIEEIENIKEKYYNGLFIPEICLVRGMINQMIVKEILDKNYFKSIDLVGDESLGVDDAIEIYEYSKKYNMVRRCHVGEFETDKYVKDAIFKLDLNEIQHCLSGIKNDQVLNLIKEKNIKINLCPQTNLIFGVTHNLYGPLRKLIDNDIQVSINTDDLLIFDKTISQIFIDLYATNKFDLDELNKIRVNNL